MPNIEFFKPIDGYSIYCMQCKSESLLAFTFIRMQEYYESINPKILGKVLSLDKFIDEVINSNGEFDYITKWGGFNIPSYYIIEFYQRYIKDDQLTVFENEFFGVLNKEVPNWQNEKFCVIGLKNKRDYLNHEVAHGLYHLDDNYKSIADEITSRFKYSKKIRKLLNKWGYHPRVVDDEIQAYMSTSGPTYLKDIFNIPEDCPEVKEYKKLFKKYRYKKRH